MRSSQVTIKDIARKLGISTSTVSRALKDHPDISVKTKKLVNELAGVLNYKPNAIALSLRSSKSKIIGLIIPEIVHHFFSSVISGIDDITTAAGYNVMIFQTNESYEKEVRATQALLFSRVDGVLVSVAKTSNTYQHFKDLHNDGIPVVFFDRTVESLFMESVLVDDYKGAFTATEHLISIGRTNLVHLAASSHLLIGRQRKQGFIDALKKHNIQFDESMIVQCDSHTEALECTKCLLQRDNKPNGIFAVNDTTAVGAMLTIKKAGLRIPEDIAIIGFGDGPIATYVEPPLTTIEQPGYQMGQRAAQILLNKLNNQDRLQPLKEILETKLIVRASTVG